MNFLIELIVCIECIFFSVKVTYYLILFLASGPVRAYRPRSPPPPPPPPPPQPGQGSSVASGTLPLPPTAAQSSASAASGPLPQRPPPQPPRPRAPFPPPPPSRQVWIPLSDGCFALDNGNTVVRRNYTGRISINSDQQGNRVVTQEPLTEEALRRFQNLEESFTGVRSTQRKATRTPPPRPPPPRIPPAAAADQSDGWLTTRNRQPTRWVSPPRSQRPESPPPPYQGIVVTERHRSPPPPYGEVSVRENGDSVRGNYF